MKKILILMSVAMLFACTQGDGKEFLEDEKPGNETENPNEDIPDGGVVYDTYAQFVVNDNSKADLLNPTTSSPLLVNSDITVYCKKGGEYHTYNSLLDKSPNAPVYDNQYGFTIITPAQSLGVRYVVSIDVIHINLEDYLNDKDISSTIVDWGNGIKDTIEVRVNKVIEEGVSYYLSYDKLWVNGKLVWDYAKEDALVDAISGRAAQLVMSEGKTSSTAYSYLKALQ